MTNTQFLPPLVSSLATYPYPFLPCAANTENFSLFSEHTFHSCHCNFGFAILSMWTSLLISPAELTLSTQVPASRSAALCFLSWLLPEDLITPFTLVPFSLLLNMAPLSKVMIFCSLPFFIPRLWAPWEQGVGLVLFGISSSAKHVPPSGFPECIIYIYEAWWHKPHFLEGKQLR